jgi:hypothetical protein
MVKKNRSRFPITVLLTTFLPGIYLAYYFLIFNHCRLSFQDRLHSSINYPVIDFADACNYLSLIFGSVHWLCSIYIPEIGYTYTTANREGSSLISKYLLNFYAFRSALPVGFDCDPIEKMIQCRTELAKSLPTNTANELHR